MSPVESLYIEANGPSLENTRIELGVQYVTKLKSYLSNPAYDCVFNPLKGRPVCFNIQTLNWRHSERSK
jgi:hypothetical protein